MDSLQKGYDRRVIRLFISSTFADFHPERNALRDTVFPRLNELCLANGLRFEPVDLRWGVSGQAVESGKILQICLSELKRCREISIGPYMLLLLGNRYGAPLLPENIDKKSFELILANMGRSAANAVAGCYRLDRNPHNAVYRLKSQPLRSLSREDLLKYLEGAAGKTGSAEMSHLISSATEHEVREALVDTSSVGGIHCFFREIEKSGLMDLGTPWIDADATGAVDKNAQQKLFDLKRSLRRELAGRVTTFRPKVFGPNVDKSYIRRFCNLVYKKLSEAIRASIDTSISLSSRRIEDSQQHHFLASRSDTFIGRKSLLKRVFNYIHGAVPHPLILHGSSGDGKSALLAKVADELLKINARLIFRFIGASPESSDGRLLLLGLCRELSESIGLPSPSPEGNVFQIAQNFRTLLLNVKDPVTIIIDAVDQLSGKDESRYLTWVPKDIPKTVRFLVSTTEGDRFGLLRQKGIPEKQFLKIPPLSLQDAREIVKRLSKEQKIDLTKSQRGMLETGFRNCRSPLFLYIAFQRARQWASYDKPKSLGSSPAGTIKMLLKEVSSDDNHGSVLVKKCLRWIAFTRFGLSHSEICKMLALDDDVIHDVTKRHPESPDPGAAFPPILWFRLYYDLLPYLKAQNIDGVELFSFFHRVWTDVVVTPLRASTRKDVHTQLAGFFSSEKTLKIAIHGKATTPGFRRFLSECPYHQSNSRLPTGLNETLLNWHFMQAKIQAFGIYNLIADYTEALTRLRKTQRADSPVQELFDFLTRFSNILARNPNELGGKLLSSESAFKSGEALEIVKAAVREKEGIWLRPEPRKDSSGALTRIFDYEQGVSSSFAEDRRDQLSSRIWGIDSFSDGTRIIAAHHDGVVRISDLTTGRIEGVLVGHTAAVSDVALCADQETILSVSYDGSLIVWSAQSYEKLMAFRTKEGLESVESHPNLHMAATGGINGMIRIWDLAAGKQVKAIRGHKDTVWSMRFDASGEFLYTVSQDGRLAKRSAAAGKMMADFGPQKGPYGDVALIRAVDVSRDGKYLVIGDGAGNIIVFDNDLFQMIRGWHAHDSVIRAIAVTPDIKKIISVSQDGFLKIWNLKRVSAGRSFNDHSAAVHAVRIDEKGKYVYSGDDNGKILIWNLSELRRRRLNTSPHNAPLVKFVPMRDDEHLVSVSSDGQISIWRTAGRKVVFSRKLEIDTYDFEYVANCVLDRNNRYLVVLSNKRIFCLDLESNRLTQQVSNNVEVFADFLAFGDEDLIATNITEDSKLTWWRLPNLDLVQTRYIGSLSISMFEMSPDCSKILIRSLDNKFSLITLAPNRRKRIKLAKQLSASRWVSFIDNNVALSHLKDGTLWIWDLESRRVTKKFAGDMEIASYALSSDRRHIFVASGEGGLYSWDFMSDKYRKLGHANKKDIGNIHVITGSPLLLFVTSGSSLNLFDCERNELLSTYTVSSQISNYHYIAGQHRVILGESAGRVHFLSLKK